jgi:hypothetical protein
MAKRKGRTRIAMNKNVFYGSVLRLRFEDNRFEAPLQLGKPFFARFSAQ